MLYSCLCTSELGHWRWVLLTPSLSKWNTCLTNFKRNFLAGQMFSFICRVHLLHFMYEAPFSMVRWEIYRVHSSKFKYLNSISCICLRKSGHVCISATAITIIQRWVCRFRLYAFDIFIQTKHHLIDTNNGPSLCQPIMTIMWTLHDIQLRMISVMGK